MNHHVRRLTPTTIRPGFALGVILCFCVLIALPFLGEMGQRERGTRGACQANMHSLDLALASFCYPPITSYPSDLSMLSNEVDAYMFICSGSKGEPGAVSNAMEWMDYIYVAGLRPSAQPGTPILICPPENHQGKGGCILDADHSTRWYPSPGIDSIISNMLSPTSAYTVVVSKRLTERTGGKYTSRP